MVTSASTVLMAAALFCSLCRAECCSFSYIQQPVQSLTCKPGTEGLLLICQAHTNADEEFDLLWLALDGQQESPRELTEPMYNIEQSTFAEVGGIGLDVKSTLHLQNANVDSLLKVYCQVRLKNQSLLPPSQTIELNPIPSSPTCNFSSSMSPLVNKTSTCIVYTLLPQTDAPLDSFADMLYVVLGVIGVFVVVIVVLTVVVVLLYRRKCGGKAEEGRPCGEGETAMEGHNRLAAENKTLTVTFPDTISRDFQAPPPSLPNHTHRTCPSMPCPPTPTDSAITEQSRNATHFLDMYRNLQEGKVEGRVSVGLEARGKNVSVAPPSYVNLKGTLHAAMTNPGYCHTGRAEGPAVTDSVYIRSHYEWNEPKTSLPCDKYRGDYERNPLYMARAGLVAAASPQDKASLPAPQRCAGSDNARKRTDKYRGDYEHCETYEYPPLPSSTALTTSTGMNPLSSSCDQPPRSRDGRVLERGATRDFTRSGKYSGDYERCPLYVQNLLKTQGLSASSHQEYAQGIVSA